MVRPAVLEHNPNHNNDVVGWLILGYLSSHPDAKDTAEGVEKWWLSGKGIHVDPQIVRAALDYLVKLGWLVSTERKGSGMVYRLNEDRRKKLRQFLENSDSVELFGVEFVTIDGKFCARFTDKNRSH
jgi:DNA-binding PadR family transcriptional regulator